MREDARPRPFCIFLRVSPGTTRNRSASPPKPLALDTISWGGLRDEGRRGAETAMRSVMKTMVIALALLAGSAMAAEPAVHEGDIVLQDFRFASGETLPELKLHYRTLGTLQKDASNAVLIMHGTGGSGAQFLRPEFAGELFRAGGELDSAKFFIVLPDGIGHGQSSK